MKLFPFNEPYIHNQVGRRCLFSVVVKKKESLLNLNSILMVPLSLFILTFEVER